MKEYKITINGNEYVTSVSIEDGVANVTVNGQEFTGVAIEGLAKKNKSMPRVAPRPAAGDAPVVAAPRPASTGGAGTPIKSPLPGVILDVFVKEGDAVKAGQRLMLLEAMKMENNIDADRGGVVKQILVQQGATVMEGDSLIIIE